jgi:5-(carboxyamino)imidazole ribonucleotide mutase
MPAGMPVATVAIDGSANAALLAAQILAVEDADLARRLSEMRAKAQEKILQKDEEISRKYESPAVHA